MPRRENGWIFPPSWCILESALKRVGYTGPKKEAIMEITTVLFDLDGTLLPMDQDIFVKTYFKLLAAKLAPLGYEPQKLIQTIWNGTMAMIANNGARPNEDAFWEYFVQVYGPDSLRHKPIIDGFYTQEFAHVQDVCGFAPMAKEIVKSLKAAGKTVVLATNPIFPAVATENRIRWAGLTPEDFLLYTTYENSSYCKPNPKYYSEILAKIGRRPEECLMVGNDVSEDMITETMGMKVFLLTDCLINKSEKDISAYPHGSFPELKEYLAKL